MTDTGLFTIRDLIFFGNQDPDRNAIESPGYPPLTYRDLRLQILTVVKSLNARGFHRNDRIAVITPSGPETAVCIIAVMAGFTVLPLNPQLKTQEYHGIFSRAGIKAIIVQEDCDTSAIMVAQSMALPVIELVPVPGGAVNFILAPEVPNGAVEPEFAIASDTAYLQLTSGTTAVSKIVTRTQKESAITKQRACFYQKITAADRCLHIMPYYHGMGVGAQLLNPLIAGGTVICTKDFIPSDFIDLLRTTGPTYYSAGPALNQAILRELQKIPPDLLKNHSLKYIRSAAGFLPEKLRTELESVLNVPVIDSYGMSEIGLIAINIPPKRGSVGIPVIDSVMILDENDEPLQPGCIGEIVIKDAVGFCGYENAPEENNAALAGDWFRTGDLGYRDDEGYLFLTGRKKELINKGGQKISPAEIDSVLKCHPGVRDAMTFGVAEPVLSEDIEAIVVRADESVTESELRRFLLDRLVQFKVPRRIHFVDTIPINPAGKPLRHMGTERYS